VGFEEFCEYNLRSEDDGQQAADCASESPRRLKFSQPRDRQWDANKHRHHDHADWHGRKQFALRRLE
jgi:hypothetical protein